MTAKPSDASTIDTNSVIGKDAEWLFVGFFRGEKWEPRKEVPDRFLDYIVEPDESGEPSGRRFGVQVKGRLKLDAKNGVISHSFKTKHLRYYLRKCKFPVFIFRFDTTSGKGYWLCVQQYAREKIDKRALEFQKTVTLHFEEKNNTGDFARFKEALDVALKYVEDLHPGSIAAAVRNRQAELEGKDPRFHADVSFANGCENVTFHANTPVSLKLELKAPAEDISNFWEKGLPTKFDTFNISGSPIFENIEQMKLVVQGMKRPGNVRLLTENGTPPVVVDVPGNFYCGAKYATFQGAWSNAPFEVEIGFQIDGSATRERLLKIRFDWTIWAGQLLLSLLHFDNVRAMTAALQKPKLILEVFGEGNLLSRTVITRSDDGQHNDEREIVEWLVKCRALAGRFGVNPRLPSISQINARQWQNVEQLYELFETGAFVSSAANISFAFDVERPEVVQGVIGHGCGAIKIVGKDQIPFDLIGVPVLVGPLVYEYTDVMIVEAPSATESRYQLKGQEASKQTMRLATSEEANS